MDTATILLALLALAATGAGVALWLRGRLAEQTAALRQEMHAVLLQQSQTVNDHVKTVTDHVGRLTTLVTQQLGQVTAELQKGVRASAELSLKAKEDFAAELKSSREMLDRINERLGEFQQAGRQLSVASQSLQSILGGAKTRGQLGEIALERLLADALPAAAYQTQYGFSTGDAVDAVVRTGQKVVPIDSKFPLEAFRRLDGGADDARRDFAAAVKKQADSIAAKYILPDEGTLDFALMFVPSENIYYELLMTTDARGARLDDYCRAARVIPVSPNTLYAYLGAILMGLKGLQVEENARRLLENLGGLNKQFGTFAEVFDKLGAHLRNAQQSHNDATARLARARTTLDQMAQGALPDAASPIALALDEPAAPPRD